MTKDKRVVITGMGTVKCIGPTVEESWAKVVAGRSGVAAARMALDQAALTITEDIADESSQ